MFKTKNKKEARRFRIKKKTRARISGTKSVPRLSVFRSNKFIYAQIIDDESGQTLVSVSDNKSKGTKSEKAKKIGLDLAKLALEKKIDKIVFDRGGVSYAGRVKALAEGAREGGLKF